MLKAINIMWDVDNIKDLKDLPTEIIIPEGMTDEEEISDYISDETGYGNYLIGGQTVSEFIAEADKLIYGRSF